MRRWLARQLRATVAELTAHLAEDLRRLRYRVDSHQHRLDRLEQDDR